MVGSLRIGSLNLQLVLYRLSDVTIDPTFIASSMLRLTSTDNH